MRTLQINIMLMRNGQQIIPLIRFDGFEQRPLRVVEVYFDPKNIWE